MTYQNSCTDTGFYTGSTINQSCNTNELLWIAKSAIKKGAFEVRGSGDGDAVYSNAADILTNNNAYSGAPGSYQSNSGGGGDPKIANSCCNNLAYFIFGAKTGAADTASEWCVQLISFDETSHALRIKFSATGFGAVTSATVVPSAADEVVLAGGGTDASPTGANTNFTSTSFRLNIIVDDDTATPRFWLATWANGTDSTALVLAVDFITNKHSGDSFPYGTYVHCDNSGAFLDDRLSEASTALNTLTAFNGLLTKRTGETLEKYCALLFAKLLSASITTAARALGLDTFVAKDPGMPLILFRTQDVASPNGWKGTSTLMRWLATPASNGDHGDLGDGAPTLDWVCVGDVWLPWMAASTCVR